MRPASEHHIPEGLLAANVLLREKPPLGFERTETTVHQASIRLNYLNGNRVSSTVVFEGRQVSLKAQQQSSQTTSNSTAPSDPIATALSNVPGVASVTPAPDPTRDKAIGGHQNETDALTFKTPEDQAKFLAESSRKHLVPGDVSENGFGPGVRLPGGLHAEQGRVDPVSGQFLVTAHIDRFNANNGLAPLVGHFVVDVMIGMALFHHSAGLDH